MSKQYHVYKRIYFGASNINRNNHYDHYTRGNIPMPSLLGLMNNMSKETLTIRDVHHILANHSGSICWLCFYFTIRAYGLRFGLIWAQSLSLAIFKLKETSSSLLRCFTNTFLICFLVQISGSMAHTFNYIFSKANVDTNELIGFSFYCFVFFKLLSLINNFLRSFL